MTTFDSRASGYIEDLQDDIERLESTNAELLEMVKLCERALMRHCPDSHTAKIAQDLIAKYTNRGEPL